MSQECSRVGIRKGFRESHLTISTTSIRISHHYSSFVASYGDSADAAAVATFNFFAKFDYANLYTARYSRIHWQIYAIGEASLIHTNYGDQAGRRTKGGHSSTESPIRTTNGPTDGKKGEKSRNHHPAPANLILASANGRDFAGRYGRRRQIIDTTSSTQGLV